MFVGRENELKLLEDAYLTGKDELVVLYGRRRIGKSRGQIFILDNLVN